MEKENNKIKKKITIKANTKSNDKLILKKDYLYQKKNDVLILNKPVNRNNPTPAESVKSHKTSSFNIVSSNIIKLNKNSEKNNNKVLEVSKISKSLGGKPILKNISFSLHGGQILGLLGPNGAGKSTLFNLIVGKITPDFGEIKLKNEIINDLPIHLRAVKGISLLEQHKGLFGNMTAYENLYAILELNIEDKNKIETRIFQLLSYFNLQYLADVKANSMSGGEYKKISTLQRICNKDIKILFYQIHYQ